MSQMKATLMEIVVFLAVLLMTSPAFADNIPPEPEPDPPHDQDASCTTDNEETDILECVECEVEHTSTSANYESCQNELEPWGFESACGSEWSEVWCRDRNAPHDYQPGDNWEEEGCSVALRQKGSFPAQLALVVGLIVFGLIVRKRLRS